jgi:muramidase (phage lysozyme)
MTSNEKAFLSMIAFSEGTIQIPNSDNGYQVLVGSTSSHPLTFSSYATHPDILNIKLNSTAAGKYQIIHPTWVSLCKKLGVSDFSPATQDAMALELIREHGAIEDINNGNFVLAVRKCNSVWASLPDGNSGQHENDIAILQNSYINSGGTINA